MGRDIQAGRSFLGRLLHDVTANTLAIAAASLMPLLAMVGGGIDASRYYMAQARLQNACDAGALAARQAMVSATFTSAHQTTANTFFDQNFHNGIFGTTGRTRSYSATSTGVVNGTASATLPTTIMGAFGFNSFQLRVTCSAEINVANTDVMFVLDVTGSMADCPNGSSCNSGTGSKIVALRSAVMSFYDTLQAAAPPTAQVRYGLVPYSQQVNVGFSIPREYLVDSHSYQSRVARFNNATCQGSRVGDPCVYSNQTEWITRLTSNLGSSNQPDYYYNNNATNSSTADSADRTRCESTNRGTFTVGNETWVISNTQYVLNQYTGAPTATRAGCRGTVRKTRPATVADITPPFRDWLYCRVTTGETNTCGVTNPAGSPPGWEAVDLTDVYNTGNTVNMPNGTSGAMMSIQWTGCLEEADTVLTDNYNPIPAGAFDIDINLVPQNDAQRWKPALNGIIYRRSDTPAATSGTYTGLTCPRAARRLGAISRTDLQNYVNSLSAGGNTYHDIGMVWGGRFLSPRGIFAVENNQAPNGDPISRHLIFMTDGEQVNSINNYSTHGVEVTDRRITGTGNSTTEFNRRAARLQAVCRAAQAENITVWVVAFGTTLTSNLTSCASPGRAFQANDSATLNAQFQQIANRIAALRLTS
jgi:Flp pilus assembly protein TadG